MNFLKKLFGLVKNENSKNSDIEEKIIEKEIKKSDVEEKIIEKEVVKENKKKCNKANENKLSLNEYQKEAIINNDAACIVSANVGSGKTTVLVSKVLYLATKCNIKDMIVLTFTNKAAQEIKDRLMAANQNLTSDDLIYCSTFHSVALALLKEKLPVTELGYTTDFSVIDPEEELNIANEIIFENDLLIKYKNRLLRRLENEKQAYLSNGTTKYNDDLFILYDLLKIEKIKQNKMTFDDLISNTITLLKHNKIHPKWIIVDEFQDASGDLLDLIDSLKDSKTQMFVVGDENQIIYTWRNTNKDVFNIFKTKYNATTLSLPINYRSTKTILEVAKSVLNKPIDLVGTRELENKIKIKKHYNSFNEAQYLSKEIKKIVKSGDKYRDIAILYRTQKQSKILIDVFANANIPYEVSYRKTLSSIPVLCWFIYLLKCSINPRDVMSLIKATTDSKYGINVTKLQVKKILSDNAENNDFINKICNFNSQKFETIFEIYDYYNLDVNIKPTSSSYESNKNLIMLLLEKINTLIASNKISINEGISEFINFSALYGTNILNENINLEKNCIKLMTLHASKGLEFKYVYIIGANKGLIPLVRAYGNEDEYNEEKRLFFVGITRAKDFLEISYYTDPDGPRIFDSPSNFLKYIPSNLVETDNNESIQSNSLSDLKKQINMNKVSDNSLDNLFDKSTSTKKINHPKYGIGKIINENEDVIVVDFEKYGEKEFLKDLEVYEIIEK
ncbi:MAG: ATP-dependent helicase [Bacilli bacterium]